MLKKNKMVISLTRIGSDGIQRLQFSQTTYDEAGIEESRRVAFKQINPDVDPQTALDAASNAEWHFTSFNRQNGTYEVAKGAGVADLVENGKTLEHA